MSTVEFFNLKIKFSIGIHEFIFMVNKKPVGKIKQLHKPPYGRFEKPNFLKPFSTCTHLSAHDATHFGRTFSPTRGRPSIHRF
jgi:hypothetical protein